MKKTILCLLLALGMLLMSAAAMAGSDPDNYSFDTAEGDITIKDGTNPGTIKVLYGNNENKDNIDPETIISIWGNLPQSDSRLSIETQVPVKIRYSVEFLLQDKIYPMSIAANADVTLELISSSSSLSGGVDKPAITLGSGSKLTVKGAYDNPNEGLCLFSRQSAILGPIDDEVPATVILNSGNMDIVYNSGRVIEGNVNLVINGGRVYAKGKDIDVKNLIVTGGELWAGNTIATYSNRGKFNNIKCDKGILPYDSDKQNILCVFGNLTLPFDLTIPGGKTLDLHSIDSLTIPKDRSLTCNELQIASSNTLTNEGTLTINYGATNVESHLSGKLINKGTLIIEKDELYISLGGTLTNTGTISGSGSITPPKRRPTLQQPASLTVDSIENGTVTLSAPANANATVEYSMDRTSWTETSVFKGVDLSAGQTFYARYKENNFFKASGDTSVSIYPVTLHPTADSSEVGYYIAGQGATLPEDVERENYSFAGWYDNVNCTGEPVTAIGADETGVKKFWAGWIAVPVITAPAENTTITVYEGERATMAITAQHAAAYQWYMSTDGGVSWTECGTDSPTYTTSPTKLENNGYQYMCVVTGLNELDKEELPPKEEIPPEGAVMSLHSRSCLKDDGLLDKGPAVESPIFTLQVIRKDAIPQTGDSSRLTLWLALLGASCAGLWCVSRRRS